MHKPLILLAACCALVAATSGVRAQDETEKAIEKYRQMLKEDPWSNPALLDADRGEGLWKTPAGPNKVSLEKCNLGKGAGVVDGAFAELPRYFADANKVMDLETRLMWCMEKLQGIQHEDLVKRPYPAGGQPVKDLGAIATYYYPKQARTAEPRLDAVRRFIADVEVQLGIGAEQALAEAQRCFSCGTCITCDNCVVYCPDLAVKRVNGGYEVLGDYCKGCGVCVKECPTGSMKMLQELR